MAKLKSKNTMTQDIKDLAFKAVQKWGNAPQLSQATEELAELIVAINHYRRGRADAREVAEEVADCQLVMQEVQQAKLKKLKRGLNSGEKPA